MSWYHIHAADSKEARDAALSPLTHDHIGTHLDSSSMPIICTDGSPIHSMTHSPRFVVSGACRLPSSHQTLALLSVLLPLYTHSQNTNKPLQADLQRFTTKDQC
ncbi:hypothetical protein GOODEAATRI_003385 [Goodea atripinnis]|uniref:Uncharacterized protein n=1 Tax=Goodea atripinnis TaxID=208336 RepID=A0ABV0PB28_9TELE